MQKRMSTVSAISKISRKYSQVSVVFSKEARKSRVSILNLEDPPACLGVRHLIVVLLFLCMLCAYILRVNMSSAIVAMMGNGTVGSLGEPTFDWTSGQKSVILSAFFWGYLVMNVPAAIIGHSVNNKRLLGGSFAVVSVLSILTPWVTSWGGYYAVIVLRVCQGLAQGFMMPMIHGLLSKWAPPQERARSATYILGGIQFGTMIVLASSGVISDSVGWPIIFYASGGIGLCWVVLWMALGGNSPESHGFISSRERLFVQRSLPVTARDNVKMSIPWKCILTSGPQYAITLAHVGQNWGMWTLLTEAPTYFTKALNFNLSDGGFLEAFPYLLMWLVSFPLAYIADLLIIKGYTSITASRKLWNTVVPFLGMLRVLTIESYLNFILFFAHFGGAAALLGMAFSEGNTYLSITLYTIAVTLNCCIYMGFNVNHLDLTPNFARILMGISNGSANITAIIAPLFVGAVVNDETDVNQWRIVFLAAAISYFLANVFFCTLGSGNLQPWNDPDYNKRPNTADTESNQDEEEITADNLSKQNQD